MVLLSHYPFILFLITILCTLANLSKKVNVPVLVIAVASALHLKVFEPVVALYSVLFFSVACVCSSEKKNMFIKIGTFAFLFMVGIHMFAHKMTGFHNVILMSDIQVSQNAVPFSLWINYDKILVGSLLFIAFYKPISKKKLLTVFIKRIAPITLISVAVVAFIATLFGMISLDFKIEKFFWIWLVVNFMVVVCEESFYRLFLLDTVLCLYRGKNSKKIAIFISSVVFGFMHFWGGIYYIVLACIAGFFYGMAYVFAEKRVESSIFCHYMLNIIHIVFFTYPFFYIK